MITCYCLSPETRPFANGAALPQLTDFTVEPSGNGFIATGRGVTVSAMAVDAPYPDEAPLRACEGNLFWPKARETVLAHKSHIALAAHHPGDGWDARRAEVIALSEVAAALCGAAKVGALYCPNGVCVAPPTRIYEALRAARAGKWLDWTPEPFVSIRCVDQRAAPGGESDATFLSAGAASPFAAHPG